MRARSASMSLQNDPHRSGAPTFGVCCGPSDHVLRPGRRLPRARDMAPQHRDVLRCQRQLCRQLRRLAGPFNQLFWSRRFIPGHLEPHRRQHKLL